MESELDALVARAVNGSADALSQLFATYGPQIEPSLRIGKL